MRDCRLSTHCRPGLCVPVKHIHHASLKAIRAHWHFLVLQPRLGANISAQQKDAGRAPAAAGLMLTPTNASLGR